MSGADKGRPRNVFVLCTGRCGSTSFVQASRHIANFTCGHESRTRLIGPARLAYPVNHIEADNRLVWLLGRLQARYGDGAHYVHLTRDRAAVAASFMARHDSGILLAYRQGILARSARSEDPQTLPALCLDYIDTVTANIDDFLVDKSHVLRMTLENAAQDFPRFWEWIGAEGDLSAAMAEWSVPHNQRRAPGLGALGRRLGLGALQSLRRRFRASPDRG